jgi:hypothetical protein
VIRYKINPLTQIGCGPNIQYDWEDDQLSFPIGIGMDSTTMIGSMPFRYGFDMQCYSRTTTSVHSGTSACSSSR